MNNSGEEKREKNEPTINTKNVIEILLVVFSMCLTLLIMFFATYKGSLPPKNENLQTNVESFEESDFYKIISYEMSKSAGECAIFSENTQDFCAFKI